MKQHNDSDLLRDELDKEIEDLKKEIDRLNDHIQNLEMIEAQHKDLNGKLQIEISRLRGNL
jgi:chaperonin cofactor prefoldin